MLADDNRILKSEISFQREIISSLKEEMLRLSRQLFGIKSERLEPGSIEIDVEPPSEPPAPEEKSKQKAKDASTTPKRTRRLKVRYRKVVEETLVPQEVQDNPTAYERLPESCDKIVRRVERVSAHLVLHNYICPGFVRSGKRSKAKQAAPIYAAAPGRILPGSNIEASIVAHVIRRANESREHVATFFLTLDERAKDTANPPTNNLRKAINYALERRAQLVSWLDNPAVPLPGTPRRGQGADLSGISHFSLSSPELREVLCLSACLLPCNHVFAF